VCKTKGLYIRGLEFANIYLDETKR